jgi:hypothetical protein
VIKLIVAGCRDLFVYPVVQAGISRWLSEFGTPDCILTGTKLRPDDLPHPLGADRLIQLWAREHGITVHVRHALWANYGSAAGPIRNRELARDGTHLLAFWDGQSAGTRNMIAHADRRGLPIMIHPVLPSERAGYWAERGVALGDLPADPSGWPVGS